MGTGSRLPPSPSRERWFTHPMVLVSPPGYGHLRVLPCRGLPIPAASTITMVLVSHPTGVARHHCEQ